MNSSVENEGAAGRPCAELVRRALILSRELTRAHGTSVGSGPNARCAPEAAGECWRALHNAAIERITKRGWRATTGAPPALDTIGRALVTRIGRDFEVVVHDRRGADTGLRAKFTAQEAPRLVKSGRTATLLGSFETPTKAHKLRFSVRADAVDRLEARRVSWVAAVIGTRCDLASATPTRGKAIVRRVTTDGRIGETIAYLDPSSIEVTRVRG